MSKPILEAAQEYLGYNLSVIPMGEKKAPAIKSWTEYQTSQMSQEDAQSFFTNSIVKGIGIVCGAVSGGLEVIDVDTKYDLTGTLWKDLKEAIEGALPEEVVNSLVIAQSPSGGYHIYYKCTEIEGNQPKLARREATSAEIEKGDKGPKPLIETRGEGGYIGAAPTPNYIYLQGGPFSIPTISVENRRTLLAVARSFDEMPEPEPVRRPATQYTPRETTSDRESPFDAYNKRGDVIGLLEARGWTVVGRGRERVKLLRPGEAKSKDSGNFHEGKRKFWVWSSSTDFEQGKPYSPSDVFMFLEGCQDDTKLASEKLLELGYGEAWEPTKNTDGKAKEKQLQTQQISVNTVSPVTGEIQVIAQPGEILSNRIEVSQGDYIVITSPGPEAVEEVLKAIELYIPTGKRIYIEEGGAEGIREYRYQLDAIFNRYGKIQDEAGGLTDLQRDSLLDEVVETSALYAPLERDQFKKEFLSQEAIQELGITAESLTITIDRLTATREAEAQKDELNKLLKKAQELQSKGQTGEALEVLSKTLDQVKGKAKGTEFSKLLLPTTEAQMRAEEASQPVSLDTGYKIGEEELQLPGGAISVIAAPTNHGKTVMLINLLLNVVERYPEKRFIFFTYEERSNAIIQYILNTYIGIDLGSKGNGNRRTYREYFKTGSTQYISKDKRDIFNQKKEEFFKNYIETGRIMVKYVDYNSKDLADGIRYLHREAGDLGGIFIDYFQLLNAAPETKKVERINNRQEELKQVCMTLKSVSVDTGLPLILAAQFNREATNLQRLHPTNIGEAGDIERVVNTLIALWNMTKKTVLKGINDAEIAEINQKLHSKGITKNEDRGSMYVELLKSRDLPTGSFEFFDYDGNTGVLKNWEKREKKRKEQPFK
jgi:replicative DNA helicase